jgi:hypothetical protein
MTKTIIAALVAVGLVGATAAPAFAHKPGQQATTEKPFPPKDFWDQQRNSGG